MTISQMREYFDVLQDKFGTPYLTDSEFETFINRGQLLEIGDLLPIEGDTVNVELNENTVMRIAPILFTVSGLHPALVTGSISKAAIETVVGNPVMRVLAVGWNEEKPVKFTRRNNWYAYKDNAFKAPSSDSPRRYEGATDWVVLPADPAANITFMGLRYPVKVSLSTPTNCELPDIFHNEIVARALSLAGVGSRDQLLLELKQMTGT
jgi:hypothetical protein